tara:strand:- start:240 stop:1493 length:1254 start_codon:yes stop_codon:yes gene_type:complete
VSSELSATLNPKEWWEQFPPGLQLIAKGRLFASTGAGAVLYLSPLLFNELGFSASQIGTGITIAAIAGTISRLITGFFLDKGIRCNNPIKLAALFAICADLLLFNSYEFKQYLLGQILLGAAAGIYWPSIELAVPIYCEKYPSSKGFALVRTADALGITLGAVLGTLWSSIGILRSIYLLDIFCMIMLFKICTYKTLNKNPKDLRLRESNSKIKANNIYQKNYKNILISLWPILMISLFSTSIFALLQSGLPLELVKGSEFRPSLSQSNSGFILSFQLALILIFQWPIGNWLSKKDIKFGLKLSLVFLGIGCLLLSLSSRISHGIYLIILSLILIAIGLTSFLPVSTESIIQIAPKEKRGLAMSMFSQCFGISSVIAPITAGNILDSQGNGFILWLYLSIISFCMIPLTNKIRLNRS